MIRIRSKRHNFRRAGIAHPKDATDYPDNRFSAEELKVLEAEPMLMVEHIEDEKPATDATGEAKPETAPSDGKDVQSAAGPPKSKKGRK